MWTEPGTAARGYLSSVDQENHAHMERGPGKKVKNLAN